MGNGIVSSWIKEWIQRIVWKLSPGSLGWLHHTEPSSETSITEN